MRRKDRVNVEWTTPSPGWTWDHVQLEVLMDIRRELQQLNAVLACPRFVGIPATLKNIEAAVAKPKAPRKKRVNLWPKRGGSK